MSDLVPPTYDLEATAGFRDWLSTLRDVVGRRAVAERIARAQAGNFGDHKAVGDKVFELRIHVGPGYRAYYTVREQRLILLLVGGTKRTQDKDIARAKAMASQI